MVNRAKFDQALGLIYESALAPERLSDALNAMIPIVNADTCHLLGLDRQTGAPSLSIAIGLNEAETTPAYFAYYGQIDPRNEIAATMTPGQVFACHNHLDAHFVIRNEFYQDYLLPQVGIHYSLGAVDLLAESEQMTLLGFHRYTGRGAFESANSATLERLLPHLRRSLQIAAQVKRRTDAIAYSETALDASNLAAFALSSSFGGGGDTMGESAWRGIAEGRKMAASTPRRASCSRCKSRCSIEKNDQRNLGHQSAEKLEFWSRRGTLLRHTSSNPRAKSACVTEWAR